ncbi:exodeoxyribonuclease V subunit gamma [Desulfatirhabdium butyrativorans]|uniref:exodeoxyribonuclease V subunit gamma n=1 Tax=Desulfatirhabdium butyrativorans TaxID=340467 RepID=UPI0012EC7F7A|nr:exodeoxyribonuclease V subunit gamma [Desulfatirhabdium butyrativorans]
MLYLYRSNRIEALLPALESVFHVPLPDPIQAEWICVHSHGARIWLEQEMSRRLGVWANVYTPFPRELIESLLCEALGSAEVQWLQQEALTFRIMNRLMQWIDRPEFAAIRRYLASPDQPAPLYGLALRIARLFDEYSLYRSDLVLAWEREEPFRGDTDETMEWQRILWRSVYSTDCCEHPASASRRWIDCLAHGWAPPEGFPSRIVLFGISSLPPLFFDLLDRFASFMDIHLFVPSPSDQYWAYVRSRRETVVQMASMEDIAVENADLFLEEGHPLLASLGKIGRDFQYLLEERVSYHEADDSLFVNPLGDAATPTLLARLQADILRMQPGSFPPSLLADGSITIHSCHGPYREIQVLKDVLLDIFRKHPDLGAHDVIVMCPDISRYAALIDAVFGSADRDGIDIPYSLSDVRPHMEAEVQDAFLGMLRLARSRLSVQEVFDFLGRDCVRLRFGFQEEDLNRMMDWVQDSGIRWGIDAAHRQSLTGSGFSENSWRFGLERMLLGAAMPSDGTGLFADTAPFEGIEGQDCLLLGELAEVIERLFRMVMQLSESRSIPDWAGLLIDGLETFFARDAAYADASVPIRQWLGELTEKSLQAGLDQAFGVELIEAMFEEHIRAHPSYSGFRSGGVTFCNLVPMRNIPCAVVCLIGMNDGAFPRKAPRHAFDLLARHPRIGDRNVREEDRNMFLEALLSARKSVVITYTGQDVQSGTRIPPSGVVRELMDVLVSGTSEEADAAGCPVLVSHPMHAYSPAGFRKDASVAHLSATDFEIAKALVSGKRPWPSFIRESIETEAIREIDIDALVRFFRNPTAFFLKSALGLGLESPATPLSDREPMFLDALERYAIESDRLGCALSGADTELFDRRIRRSGKLPPAVMGKVQYGAIRMRTNLLIEAALQEGIQRREMPIRIALGERHLRGRIPGVSTDGPIGMVVCHNGRLKASRQMEFWLRHLALQLALPRERRMPSRMIGVEKDRGKDRITSMTLAALTEPPDGILAGLIDLYLDGLGFPLPFFPETSLAYARALSADGLSDDEAMRKARGAWEGSKYASGEAEEESAQMVYRTEDPFSSRQGAVARRFKQIALAVWRPFLDAVVPK